MDIYDYCARFDCTPTFIFREITRISSRKPLIEATVELPEQGIQASARASEKRTAEILACVEFKKQAEEYHATHGESTIIVKDLLTLNNRNAKKFFEYYKMHNRNAQYDLDVSQAAGLSKKLRGYFSGQIILDGAPIGEPVEMHNKKSVEAVAYLAGAVALKKANPHLFPKFLEALRIGNGELLRPVVPSWANIEQDCVLAMMDTLLSVRRVGLPPSEKEGDIVDAREERSRRMHPWRRLDETALTLKNAKLREAYDQYMTDPELATLRQKREELPMNQYREKVLNIVENHPVSIIVGATGSGKTSKHQFCTVFRLCAD